MENKLKSSELLAFSDNISEKMVRWAKSDNIQMELTAKGKERLVAGARNAYVTITSKGLSPYNFDVNNLVNVFQQVVFLPISPNAYPQQSFFKIQKVEGKPTLVYELQGDGFETLLKVYGEDVQRVRSWVIREGDIFSGIEYLGADIVPPKIRLLTNDEIVEAGLHKKIRKVKSVIYAIWTTFGIEWYVANREDVKANIIAQAKNNGASVEVQREMAQYGVDEILDPNGKFLEMKVKNQYGSTVSILSPTYRDPSSVEGMIITKLKKYICNKYSKDFDRDPENKGRGDVLKAIYQETLQEDKYREEIETKIILESEEQTFDKEANKKSLKQEPKGEKLVIKQEEEIVEEAEIEEHFDEQVEDGIEDDESVEDIEIEKEEVVEEKPSNKVATPNKNDVEDWM